MEYREQVKIVKRNFKKRYKKLKKESEKLKWEERENMKFFLEGFYSILPIIWPPKNTVELIEIWKKCMKWKNLEQIKIICLWQKQAFKESFVLLDLIEKMEDE